MSAFCYTPPALIFNYVECQAILGQVTESPNVSLVTYLQYFFLTCLLEAPFYFYAIKLSRKFSWPRFLSALLLCNLATHPIVCFAIPALMEKFHGAYSMSLSLGESFAPITEALLLSLFWKVPGKKAILVSFAANLFSWWAGVYLAELYF